MCKRYRERQSDRDTCTEREIKWIELHFLASTHCYNLETAVDFGLKLQPTTFSLIFFNSQCYNLETAVEKLIFLGILLF